MTKYKQVARDLINNIEKGIYTEKIPSEKKLANDYQVSINTYAKPYQSWLIRDT